MNIKNYFHKVNYILGKKNKVFLILFSLFVLISITEALSLVIIAPYLTLLIDNNSSINDSFIYNIIQNLNINENIIFSFGILIIIIFSFKLFFSLFNIFIINKIAWSEIVHLRLKLLISFKSMNYDMVIKKNSAEYINLIGNLAGVFVKQTFFPLIKIASDIIMLITILIFLATLNIYILLSVFIILFIFLIIYDSFFKKKSRQFGYLVSSENEKMLKNITDMFYGFKEINVLNKLFFFIDKTIEATKNIANNQIKIRLISDSPRYIYEFIIVLLLILFIIFYSIHYNNNIVSIIPTISVFILAFLRLLPIISNFNQHLTHLRASLVANDLIYEQLKKTELLNKNFQNINNDNFNSLEFKNVSFSYEDGNEVLNQINFKINRGEMVGIIGNSGSGKSTFVDIFLGLLKPNNGSIIFNNKEINFESDNNIIKNISSYLPQENFVFENNILKNVSLEDNIDNDKLNKIKDLLHKIDLSIDLNKNLGDRGVNLSGGQRQRVSIARSLYHNRQILIMDESTSALDKDVELEILRYLNTIKSDVTIILISHKIETLKFCQKIYKIQNKKILEVNKN